MSTANQDILRMAQLSVSGISKCTKYRLGRFGLSMHRKSVDMLIGRLDMTIVVDWDI